MIERITTNMPNPNEPPPAKAPGKPKGPEDAPGEPGKDKPPSKPD